MLNIRGCYGFYVINKLIAFDPILITSQQPAEKKTFHFKTHPNITY